MEQMTAYTLYKMLNQKIMGKCYNKEQVID